VSDVIARPCARTWSSLFRACTLNYRWKFKLSQAANHIDAKQRGQDFALVDGGAPAARYSGSAAGAGGQRDWGCGNCLPDFDERRASRVATHPPP